jgi:hypothetical protein
MTADHGLRHCLDSESKGGEMKVGHYALSVHQLSSYIEIGDSLDQA